MKPKLLIVEDDVQFATILKMTMQAKFEVSATVDLASARNLLSCPDNVDVVLLDMNLVDSRGLDTVRIIKDFPAIPFIVMTGYGGEHKEDCEKLGASGFLEKGNIRTPELAELVEKVVQKFKPVRDTLAESVELARKIKCSSR